MKTKDKVLSALLNHREEELSGQTLADHLGVSRNAIWAAVKTLQKDGVPIRALANKGYRLPATYDPLQASYFKKTLAESAPLWVYPTVDSTNDQLKNLARAGAVHGSAVLADHQSAGKGRLGRSFYSPALTGLYVSVLLKPDPSFQVGLNTTLKAAVLAARCLEKYGAPPIGVKWVNDLYTSRGKVAGILTEATINMENGMVDTVVVGVGINLLPPKGGFPEDIASHAAALFTPDNYRPIKNPLAQDLVEAYRALLKEDQDHALLSEYRERSVVLGKEVLATMGDRKIVGTVTAIRDDGALVLERADGQPENLMSAEISLRGNFGFGSKR